MYRRGSSTADYLSRRRRAGRAIRPPGAASCGEGAELDELVADGETAADHRRRHEAERAAHAGSPLGRPGSVERLADEGVCRLLVGLGVLLPERLQGVPLHEARKELGEDVGAAHEVEGHGQPGDLRHRADLTVHGSHRVGHPVDVAAAVVVEVAQGVARGIHVVGLEAVTHLLPDLALVGTRRSAGGSAEVRGVSLRAAQVRIGGLRRGREVLVVAPRVPATVLDAGHVEVRAVTGLDEHGGVEAAVLLSAEHLLPLVDEQREVGGVLEAQLTDGGAAVELLDEGAELDGLGEGAVGELTGAADDGEDGEGAGGLRGGEGEFLRESGHAWLVRRDAELPDTGLSAPLPKYAVSGLSPAPDYTLIGRFQGTSRASPERAER